ncbi:MAG: ATP-binding protein, partial [bacterium]
MAQVSLSKLPTISGDLFGREQELRLLDEVWADPQTHVIMLSAWGGVGKTALVNHWLTAMERDGYRGAEQVYGWSFYSQGTREDKQASGDEFIAHALEWFGDPDPAKGAPWDKGVRLALLVRARRTLLILDGLEPLQYPPGEMKGRLRDQGVLALLKELARAGSDWGLCAITTRLLVPELAEMKRGAVRLKELENLSNEAGAQLLR